MRDYVAWHDAYGEPGSPLWQRLRVVRSLIGRVLDELAPGAIRFVSLCAGQGDDVLGVAATHTRGVDLRGRMVELDPTNAAAAASRVEELGLAGAVEVRTGDAALTDAYEGAVPADLVVACGIFGNIALGDVEQTVRALPMLCAPGAHVVWTRHPREPGVLDAIHGWFADAGFEQVALRVDEDQGFGVGLHRLVGPPAPLEPGRRLFTFLR